jgi:hypothetical protein
MGHAPIHFHFLGRAVHAFLRTETTGTQHWVTRKFRVAGTEDVMFLEGKIWTAIDLGSTYQ